MTRPAILVLGPSAEAVGQQIAKALNGELIRPEPKAARPGLEALFAQGRPIVGICASAILIRILGPLLADKTSEPPVVAVAEDGSTAVPLLGGHHGANELARQIAAITGGHAAITTASEVRFGVNLESPAPGYVLANPEHHKSVIAAMLRGEKLRHKGEAEWLSKLPLSAEGSLSLLITEHAVPGSARALVYHPKTIVIGAGCERNAEPQALIDLAETMLANEGLSPKSVAAIASIDLKADETCIHALARHFDVPVRFFTAEELRRQTARLKNPSETVLAEVGVAGVSEASALALAGPTSELIAEKQKGNRVTAAIALAEKSITEPKGRAQGVLHVIGLGPGAPEWRSPAASQALLNATEWVGYGLYLDLAEDLTHGEQQHRFPLGGEEARVRHAIQLAAEGKQVALICSGDAGIYAMASLVYEVLALEPSTIAVNVIPGISAFQAAAARAGALIGHDFCCISLSDLLTPWEVIERRVKAAAEGDFVVAFYNPRSLKRTDQIEHAIKALRQHRPDDTPLVIASNLGRPTEQVNIKRLADFDANEVDMLTLVMVGSSQSQAFPRGDGKTYAFTPRGYAKKRDQNS